MRGYRSVLFVPGHKPDWAPKALKAGPDVIVLDLEDSVPDGEKAAARRAGARRRSARCARPTRRSGVFVRVNGASHPADRRRPGGGGGARPDRRVRAQDPESAPTCCGSTRCSTTSRSGTASPGSATSSRWRPCRPSTTAARSRPRRRGVRRDDRPDRRARRHRPRGGLRMDARAAWRRCTCAAGCCWPAVRRASTR